MKKKNLVVFFGGASSEHEVSRRSAEFVISNISEEKYNIIKVGITKKGKWLLYNGTNEKISDGSWEHAHNKQVLLSPDKTSKGIIVINDGKAEFIDVDVAFPVLHGKNGEDGTIQGLFQLAGIPFVGCDVCSSCTCMDKAITNIMLTNGGVKKANFVSFWATDFFLHEKEILDNIENKIQKYPMFVKPANAGSSVGISKVFTREELKKAIEVAACEDSKILVEETIIGKEVECAVIGNDDPIASVVGEIVPSNEFYDYTAKYISNSSKLFIPARIDQSTSEKIRQTALKAYRIMGCSGLSRIDFFVKAETNEVILNEINTLPGFTSISMYPKLFEASGIESKDLIEKLIELAFERFSKNE